MSSIKSILDQLIPESITQSIPVKEMDERQIIEKMKRATQSYQRIDIMEEIRRRASIGGTGAQQSLKEFVSRGGVYIL